MILNTLITWIFHKCKQASHLHTYITYWNFLIYHLMILKTPIIWIVFLNANKPEQSTSAYQEKANAIHRNKVQLYDRTDTPDSYCINNVACKRGSSLILLLLVCLNYFIVVVSEAKPTPTKYIKVFKNPTPDQRRKKTVIFAWYNYVCMFTLSHKPQINLYFVATYALTIKVLDLQM